jgi:cytochrome b561
MGYGAIAMTLHWAVVVLVLGSWFSGQFGDELPRGAPRDTGLFVHISLGIAIVGFVLARLFWRLAGPPRRRNRRRSASGASAPRRQCSSLFMCC